MPKTIPTKTFVVLIILISFLFFGKTFNHEFVWDDELSHLTRHEDVMKGNLANIWAKPYDGMYIPVTYTIWTGVKKFSYNKFKKELNPKLFHFTNILFHTSNSILVFLILMLLFKNSPAAFVGTLFFLLHPLQVESVAWVSEFRGVLSVFFSLLSIYVLLKNIDFFDSFKTVLRSRSFILATLFYVLALLSKPSAVALPFVALILIWAFYTNHFKTALKAIIIWFLLFIPILLLTSKSQTNEIMNFIVPIAQRPLVASYSIAFYFYKIILPFNLSACYGITPETIIKGWEMYAALILTAGIFLFLFLKRSNYKILFTSYSIIVFSLLPVIGLVTFYYQRYSNVADRYMYFGMFGIALLIAHFWNKKFNNDYLKYALGVFLVIISFSSFYHLDTWKNEFTLWDNAMKQNPNQWNAAYNRGVYYTKVGKSSEAIEDYTIALRYKPNDSKTLTNRANAYGMLNRYEEAITDYSTALKLNEKDASIYYNRALTYYYMKNIKACSYDLQMAMRMGFKPDPQFVRAVKAELNIQFGSR